MCNVLMNAGMGYLWVIYDCLHDTKEDFTSHQFNLNFVFRQHFNEGPTVRDLDVMLITSINTYMVSRICSSGSLFIRVT